MMPIKFLKNLSACFRKVDEVSKLRGGTPIKTIYILLTKTNTIVSRMVGITTKAPYTHTAISFDRSCAILYSSSRKNGLTMFPAGPCIEHLNYGYFKRHPETLCALYELTVSDEAYEQALREAEYIIKNSDKYHYNTIGLILCKLDIPYHRRYHVFCSEFVAEILCRSQALVLPKDTSLMKPYDFTQMSELSCCFCGHTGELAARLESEFSTGEFTTTRKAQRATLHAAALRDATLNRVKSLAHLLSV